jgi:hypothetical protein
MLCMFFGSLLCFFWTLLTGKFLHCVGYRKYICGVTRTLSLKHFIKTVSSDETTAFCFRFPSFRCIRS